MKSSTDLFKQAQESLTIAQAWVMLGLPGEPRPTCKSPFRDERTASFSIHADGKKWKDHGADIGGDVVEFIKNAIGGDYSAVREWLQPRIGIIEAPRVTNKPVMPKSIQYPAATTEGTERHWRALAVARELYQTTAEILAKFGMVKFMHHHRCDKSKCRDPQNRQATVWKWEKSLSAHRRG